MKKTKFVRLLALCLAAVSLIGIVGALSYDKNGDNKTNVWDLQLMVNEGASEEELEKALNAESAMTYHTVITFDPAEFNQQK